MSLTHCVMQSNMTALKQILFVRNLWKIVGDTFSEAAVLKVVLDYIILQDIS